MTDSNMRQNKNKWFDGLFISFKVVFFFSLFIGYAIAEQQTKTYSESQIKVALVYKLLHFIEWPPSQDLTLCVFGANDEDTSSFRSMPQTTEFGNSLNVTFLQKNGDSLTGHKCQLVFFSGNTNADIRKILTDLTDTHSLTIGEAHQFIKQGGMINFVRKDATLTFEINIKALKQAGLNISSQVLRIADRIYTEEEDDE
jgi:uncharacterized protein DUF4154